MLAGAVVHTNTAAELILPEYKDASRWGRARNATPPRLLSTHLITTIPLLFIQGRSLFAATVQLRLAVLCACACASTLHTFAPSL